MDTVSLRSYDSASTKKSKKRFSQRCSGLVKVLQAQYSRASLRSETSDSSALSRALVLWFPKFQDSTPASRNASVDTIPVYPMRDPTRIQNSNSPLIDTERTLHRIKPANLIVDNASMNDRTTESRIVDTTAGPIPIILLLDRLGEAIQQILRNDAVAVDKQFRANMATVIVIRKHFDQAVEFANDGMSMAYEEKVQSIAVIVRSLRATAASIAIYSSLVLVSINRSYYRLFRDLCKVLASQLPTAEHLRKDIFYIQIQVIVEALHSLRHEPIVELAEKWVHTLAMHLPETSIVLAVSKILLCRTYLVMQNVHKARNLWEAIDKFPAASLNEGSPRCFFCFLRGDLGYGLGEYLPALLSYQQAYEYAVLERFGKTTIATILYYLSTCNYKLGRFERAIQKAEQARVAYYICGDFESARSMEEVIQQSKQKLLEDASQNI